MKHSAGPVFSNESDLAKSLRWVGIASAKVKQIDYAVSGGMHTVEDTVKSILAGASAVEICSALYQGSDNIIREYLNFLEHWMMEKGMDRIDQFKGMLNAGDTEAINYFERTQSMKSYSNTK